MLRRFLTSARMTGQRPLLPGSSSPVEPLYGSKLVSDINVRHNLAVQKYSVAPYNLQTRVVVISHNKGYMATLEWKWQDPARNGRTIVAVTSGIDENKKTAISHAYRAMLTKQKLLDDSVTAQQDAIVEADQLVKEGHYGHACKALFQASATSPLPLRSVKEIILPLWRKVLAMHDTRLVDQLVSVLEKAQGGMAVSMYEDLLQECVYIRNNTFSERTILSLSSDRVKLEVPSRGLMASGDTTSTAEVQQWKYWRSLVALEENAGIHSALSVRDTLATFRLKLETITVPILKLTGWTRESSSLPSGLLADSLVLLAHPNGDASLTGKVKECVARPDENSVVTIELLTEESSFHDNSLLFTAEELDLVVLAESRVTFDRISNCLREYFRVSPVPDLKYRFSDLMRRNLNGSQNRPSIQAVPSTPPSLAFERRHLNLSDNQMKAVLEAMRSPLTLIHGPAGTGKTHTLCGIVSAWKNDNADAKILCCSDSNTAADNIAAALGRRDISCFRLGTWKALSDVPDEILDKLPNKSLVDKYRGAGKAFARDPARHRGFLLGLRKQVEEEAIKNFQVIVTTLSSARNPALDRVLFPRVIVDEAAQAIEPATLLALSHGCERLVLMGDHKQLPAVVLSKTVSDGLSKSLFERLIDSGHPSILLNCQRRMHPSIVAWPNQVFYDGELETHSSLLREYTMERPLLHFPFFMEDNRVVFVNTDGHTTGEEAVGTSTRNTGECWVLAGLIERLINSDVLPERIGVIVPYLAQKHALLSALRSRGLLKKSVQISTVEGFQGHEKDYILVSTTRSNVNGALGFLEDDRRMNVMLTRARKGLIVVGDKPTLKKRSNSRWHEYMTWIEESAITVPVDEL